MTKLRFCLKSSRLMVEGCFLKRRNAARLSFIALAMAGVTYGFFGLKFLITLDEMWLWIDCRNVDCHDNQAESISAATREELQSADPRTLLIKLKSAVS